MPVSLCVIESNGIVVAHSASGHSANHRSAVVSAIATALDPEESHAALGHTTETLPPGRVAEIQPMTRKKVAATRWFPYPSAKVNGRLRCEPAERRSRTKSPTRGPPSSG